MIYLQKTKRRNAKSDTNKNKINGYDLAGHAVQHSDLVEGPSGWEVPHDQLVARGTIAHMEVPDHFARTLSHSSKALLAPWTRTSWLAVLTCSCMTRLTCSLMTMKMCSLLTMLSCSLLLLLSC